MKTLIIVLLALLLIGSAHAQTSLEDQFPENPQPVKRSLYGGYELDPDKVIKEPRVFTKKFLFAHGLYLSATVFDIETTHQGLAHHKCVEGGGGIAEAHVGRGELYRTDMLVFGVTTGLDILFQASHPPKWASWIPYMGSTVGTVKHIHGGMQWYQNCW
jgi:hypothetical protein